MTAPGQAIPVEAIEAAIKAARCRAAQLHNLRPDDFDMTVFRKLLEAAAPILVEVGRDQAMADATEYTICAIPDRNSINWHTYAIQVAYRGKGRWAVVRNSWCLGTDGTWDYERRPSDRADEWLATHRFDLDTALRLAREAAPGITVNGRTAAEVAVWAEPEQGGQP